MKRIVSALCLFVFLMPALLVAESKNPADYPLRVHIFGRDQTTFYHSHMMDEAKGDGRANLFANGEVHGVDFSYECSEKLRTSMGYETYPARWKKPQQELVVLLPVFGHANTYSPCHLKTDVKDVAYYRHNGSTGTEPAAAFKAWMVKHDYDPEHGKDMPVKLAGNAGQASQ